MNTMLSWFARFMMCLYILPTQKCFIIDPFAIGTGIRMNRDENSSIGIPCINPAQSANRGRELAYFPRFV